MNEEPNLGFHHDDYNWLLMDALPSETLSKLPLKSFQIDYYARNYPDKLDWDILSTRQLDGWLFVKYKDKINWEIFLSNGKPKEFLYLLEVKDILLKYQYIFFKEDVKKMYYSIVFISAFPELTDWKWCARYVKLNDYLIRKFWRYIPIKTLCRYQDLSEEIISEKKYQLNWTQLCRRQLSEEVIDTHQDLVDWVVAFKWQNITEKCLINCLNNFKNNKKAIELLCRYQKLSEDFIEQNIKWLNWNNIMLYQDLSVGFIKKYQLTIDFNTLEKNINYNNEGQIQIIKHRHGSKIKWYVVDSVYINQSNQEVVYCDVNYFAI